MLKKKWQWQCQWHLFNKRQTFKTSNKKSEKNFCRLHFLTTNYFRRKALQPLRIYVTFRKHVLASISINTCTKTKVNGVYCSKFKAKYSIGLCSAPLAQISYVSYTMCDELKSKALLSVNTSLFISFDALSAEQHIQTWLL